MPLSRVILSGALPIAKNHTSSSGSWQTRTGKMLLLTPSSPWGHGAQVRSPPQAGGWEVWNGWWAAWAAGEWMWTSVSPWRGRNCWEGSVSPSNITRSLQENALCSPRGGWNNMQGICIIFSSLAFLSVRFLQALLPACMSATGEHH